jgi:hypothetical protein
MNVNQRHEFEYLLHLLDDEDIKVAEAILSGRPIDRRRHDQPVHWIGGDRRRNRFAPTPRMMVAVTLGMVGVSVISWTFAANNFPNALYMMPLYLVYVAVILAIKAVRLRRRWVVG